MKVIEFVCAQVQHFLEPLFLAVAWLAGVPSILTVAGAVQMVTTLTTSDITTAIARIWLADRAHQRQLSSYKRLFALHAPGCGGKATHRPPKGQP
jgi:hypothetical protein